ncbi:MAG TPA: hypothetical protein VFM82_07645 [Flavobacteriaceae bacterium]|nr:hypothetical protein [Flavobacteriaceae bacterium]
MPKFIHPDFTLELSNTGINELEESHFFKDSFFTKFTMPFDFDITDELNKVFKALLSDNSTEFVTYFEGYYYHFGKSEKAVLEIEEVNGRKASATLKYGVEELANAEKKLSEFSLEEFELPENVSVYQYAKSIIDLTWPVVTHNFPAVHQVRLKESGDQWLFFEGVINNYLSGQFVENSYDEVEDDQLNKNLMQPMPYLLHVLQKGFADAGFELAGDILTDPDFKKACICMLSEYYTASNLVSGTLEVRTDEYDSLVEETVAGNSGTYEDWGLFENTYQLPEPGRYKIAGNIYLRIGNRINHIVSSDAHLWFGGDPGMANAEQWNEEYVGEGNQEIIRTVDLNLNYYGQGDGIITFTSQNLIYGRIEDEIILDALVADLTISQLSKFDANGNPMPTLNVVKDIRLNKCVPEMTFGELITAMKNWRNLDIVPSGGIINMNYVQQEVKRSEIVDLSDLDEPTPRKTYHRGDTYLLGFQDVESDDYSFPKIFVSKNGISTENYVKTNQTNEITVNALPLPVAMISGRTTADLFHDNTDKLNIVLYDGLNGGTNNTDPPNGLGWVQNYQAYWRDWLNFRLGSIGYEWNIKLYESRLRKLGIKNRLLAYNRVHIIKTLNKKQLHDDLWEVEVVTES